MNFKKSEERFTHHKIIKMAMNNVFKDFSIGKLFKQRVKRLKVI